AGTDAHADVHADDVFVVALLELRRKGSSDVGRAKLVSVQELTAERENREEHFPQISRCVLSFIPSPEGRNRSPVTTSELSDDVRVKDAVNETQVVPFHRIEQPIPECEE